MAIVSEKFSLFYFAFSPNSAGEPTEFSLLPPDSGLGIYILTVNSPLQVREPGVVPWQNSEKYKALQTREESLRFLSRVRFVLMTYPFTAVCTQASTNSALLIAQSWGIVFVVLFWYIWKLHDLRVCSTFAPVGRLPALNAKPFNGPIYF